MTNHFLSANVPDPTDFPPNNIAPGLRVLDGSLRCNICGELYDAPVTLSCGHCFCSVCVRSSLAEKQECPTCRKTAIEGHIRPNPVVEEIISSWQNSRPYILRLSREYAQRQDEQRDTSLLVTPVTKKRKITSDTGRNNGVPTSSRGSAPTSPSKSKRTGRGSEDPFNTTIPTSDVDEDEMPVPMAGENPQPDDLIECPLCNKHVRFKIINQHMDKRCKDIAPDSGRSTMNDWKKIMAGPNKGKQKDVGDDELGPRLPKASYDTLKDKKLKEMLTEYGLWTNGDRSQCINRHQRWVMIYNANLDRSSKNRQSKLDLRKELKKWEEEKSKKKKTTVEDVTTYQKRHKDEFAHLIMVARPRGDTCSASAVGQQPITTGRGNGDDATESLTDKKQPHTVQTNARDDSIVVDSEDEEELTIIQRT